MFYYTYFFIFAEAARSQQYEYYIIYPISLWQPLFHGVPFIDDRSVSAVVQHDEQTF